MNIKTFLVLFLHYFRRMTRAFVSLFTFVGLPVAITGLLSYIYSTNAEKAGQEFYMNGYNLISTSFSMHMMVMFQLNGGLYLLNYLYFDLMQSMKWRFKATPVSTHSILFAAAGACTVFTTLQGCLIMLISGIFFDAYWGNPFISVLVVLLVSLISQLTGMLLLVLTRNIETSETLSWTITWGMAIMGGMMFTLPDTGFFKFMELYGTPYSLARTAIYASGFLGDSVSTLLIALGGLSGCLLLLGAIAIPLGRRSLV